jgi:tetratricopeptide (TPR) repeat protein
MARDALDYSLHTLRAVGIARSTGDIDQLARAYSQFAYGLTRFGLTGLGIRFVSQAERYVTECGSQVTKAYTNLHIATAYLFAGSVDRAREIMADAQAQLDKYSHRAAESATIILRRIYGLAGATENELAIAAAEVAMGEQTDSAMIRSWGEFGMANALARSGRIPEALLRSERAVQLATTTDSPYTRVVALQIRGFVFLQASRYGEAAAACEDSVRSLATCQFHTDLTLLVYAYLAESLVGPNWSGPPEALDRQILEKAWRLGRKANRAGNRFPNLLPHALRARGRAAWALGRQRKAADYLERSIIAAEKHGARYDLARALLDASRVIPEKADEYRRRGQQLLDELGAVVPEAERLSP